jgi:hypothetical protein
MPEHVNVAGQCEVACTRDRLVALMAGDVLCVDFRGRMVWLRQRSPLDYQIDPGIPRQRLQPAIISAGRVFLQQPGSCFIECLTLETGERSWQRGLVGLQSVAELPDKLLARTDWGLVALSKETGDVLWQRAVPNLLAADARTRSGLVVAARQIERGDKSQIEFRWLDSANGRWLGRSTLPLTDKRPVHFGPLVAREGRVWAAVGYGAKDDSPTAENNKHIAELRFTEPIAESEMW